MVKQTVRDNLEDLVREMGGTPKGETTAELIDQLEDLVKDDGDDITPGTITDDDMNALFGE